jgi:hypothetical protein
MGISRRALSASENGDLAEGWRQEWRALLDSNQQPLA